MRRRLSMLLVMLTIMLGTIVVASGILREPLPEAAVATIAERPTATSTNRSESRGPIAKDDGAEVAPLAAEQEPTPAPDVEPPPPPKPSVPGGTSGVAVPTTLGGEFLIAPGKEKAPPGRATYRVRVEVEDGLPVDVEEFADFVMATINDERSWAHDGAITFSRTDGDADIRMVLASPATVDENCAPLTTNGMWSCGRYGKAMINADRWINGAEVFEEAGGDLLTYRQYVINHEIGHLVGFEHVDCPAEGELAPVMGQQSMRLNGCLPNGWVHP